MRASDTHPLPCREAELARIDALLGDVARQVPVAPIVVIEGEAGIGKTRLLAESAARARARGVLVLSASAVESEAHLEFSALFDLFAPVPEAVLATVPEPQRRAVEVALARRRPGRNPPDAAAVSHAVLGVLRAAAAESPILIAIDDVPWIDSSSATALAYALRRLGGEGVATIATRRTGWSADPEPRLLDPFPADVVERIAVGPMDDETIRALVAAASPIALDAATVRRIAAQSAGNPFFAQELAAAVARQGDPARGLPDSLGRLVGDRVRSLPARVRHLLLVAALAAVPSIAVVGDAIADPDYVFADVDTAAAAGVVEYRGGRVVFVHPLLRSAVTSGASAVARRAVHRRLATVETRPEEHARHLAHAATGPDATVATKLIEAANRAERRGAVEAAGELAELAVTLTPPSDAERDRRALYAAECWFRSRDPARATALAGAVSDRMPPGPGRVPILLALERYRRYTASTTRAWIPPLEAVLEEAGDDRLLQGHVLGDLALAYANTGDDVTSYELEEQALHIADEVGARSLAARLAAGLAFVAFRLGHGVRSDLIERALEPVDQPPETEFGQRPRVVIGLVLGWADEHDRARQLLETEYEDARTTGQLTGLPVIVVGLVPLELQAGRWQRSEEMIDEGYDAAELSGSPLFVGGMAATRAMVHAVRGRLDECRADTAFAYDNAAETAMPMWAALSAHAAGVAALSIGDAAACHAQLGSIVDMIVTAGVAEPGLTAFVADDAEALARLGEYDRATQVLDAYELRAHALGRLSAMAAAARARSLVLAGGGDLVGATAAIGVALELHDTLALPFERARTLFVAGELDRRARRKRLAATHLDAAVALFDELGAPRWAELARGERERVGLRRADAGEQLSEVERRVADLVAGGHSNREIAAELFMAVRTVEHHLTRIYRKLGVRSRGAVARALEAGPPAAPPDDHAI